MRTLKFLLIVVITFGSITTYAQIRRLDTLSQEKRDKIIIDMAIKEMIKESSTEYRPQDTPTIYDVGVWQGKEKSSIKSDAILYIPGSSLGKKIYVITYPLNEEEKKYCSFNYDYKFIMVVNGESGYSEVVIFGPTKETVIKGKAYLARQDTIRKKRAEYLEKQEQLRKERENNSN